MDLGSTAKSPAQAAFGSFDVEAAFDESVGRSTRVVADIYPTLQRYRHEAPVYAGDILADEWGTPSIAAIAASLSGVEPVSVFRHEDCLAVLRDGSTFSSEVYLPSLGQIHGRSFMMMDAPDHQRYRSLAQPRFAKRFSDQLRSDYVEPTINRLLDDLERGNSADLFRSFALIFPALVLHRLLGLDEQHAHEFQLLGLSSLLFGTHPEVAMAGAARLGELLRQEIDRGPQAARPDGLLSDLLLATLDGAPLTPEEITPYFGTILAAGAETTMRSTLNTMLGLLRHPDQAAMVAVSPEWAARAVEETLRWEPPIAAVFRQATRDCEIGASRVRAGAPVVVWVASGNHDESVFEEPERFDIQRPAKAQLGFGFGPHLCVGMHLARMETATAVSGLLGRFPSMKLNPSVSTPEIVGTSFRSPRNLEVVW
jgi:cytochrome P450